MILMITGPSGCGKSSVAAAVAARCDGALVVQQDHYFAGEFTPYAEAVDDASERPEHVDWPRLRDAVDAARAGAAARAPVLVEGHAALCDEALVARCDAVVFLSAERESCCARRVGRRARPAAEAASLRAYYERFAWPAHERDVRPRLDALRARADNARPALHVCAAEQPLERVVAEVFERVGPLQLERARGADG